MGREEDLCERLVLDIKEALEDKKTICDIDICPWCLINQGYYTKDNESLRFLSEACSL